jgi:CHAT domain-containing protein/predicted negative regulator of RcsB-dependent stress response
MGNKNISIELVLRFCLFLPLTMWGASVSAQSPTSELYNAENYQSTGNDYWQQGNLIKSIEAWKEAALIFRRENKKNEEIEVLLNLSQSYISLGQFQTAVTQLERVVALSPEAHLLALAQKRLGNAYSGLGSLSLAVDAYQKSLERETSLSTLNNLIKVLEQRRQQNLAKSIEIRQDRERARYQSEARRDRTRSLNYASLALKLSKSENSLSSVRALIQWQNLSQQPLNVEQLNRGRAILEKLPPSRSAAFLMLNWAKIDTDEQITWLNKARQIAQTNGDIYLESYVDLEFGYFYDRHRDLNKSLYYARLAQLKAQSKFAYDTLFRAQRLAGQIYQKKGQTVKAIESYRGAIASLDTINRSLSSTNLVQGDLNQKSELIYREALNLLLNSSTSENLKEALLVFDRLRLTQLKNYFGDNCWEIARKNLSEARILQEKKAALINSIILEDKVFLILQLPDGRIIKSERQIKKAELNRTAMLWHQELQTGYTWQFRTGSRFFYDLMIKPFETELESSNLKVLVFIHDGILRNLPMAALLDDRSIFLAQKWASVSSIGLNLSATEVDPQKSKALVFGLTNSLIPGWRQLDKVSQEIRFVENLMGGDKYSERQFTSDNLLRQLTQKKYSIVHLATHGYFSGDASTSFILGYNQKISALKLKDILFQSRQPIDLLVLSACETAVGSDLALLGLAGVAAKSGVASTLGTLWQVNDDEQFNSIESFYAHFNNDPANKAIAIQQVQIEQIRNLAHPQTWAAPILLGDW